MRVCHVADFLPDLHRIAGGAEYAAQRVITNQLHVNFDVSVVTTKNDFPCQLGKVCNHYLVPTLDNYLHKKITFALKQVFIPYDPLAASSFGSVLKKETPDIIHFHNLHYLSLSLLKKAQHHSIPSILSIYDYWLFCPNFMLLNSNGEICVDGHGSQCVDCFAQNILKKFSRIKRSLFAYRKTLITKLAEKVSHFIVLSHSSRNLLIRHGIPAEKTTVIPQYFAPQFVMKDQPSEPVLGRLLYAGWIEKRKGLHIVIDALIQLAEKYPDLHLHVAGSTAEQKYQDLLEAEVTDAGLSSRVKFMGNLKQEQLQQEMTQAHLVIIPEQWENMSPVILMESMAMKKCVLASNLGGIPEFIEDRVTGLLAEFDDAGKFANQIEWALHNPHKCREIGNRANECVLSMHDSESINGKFKQIYSTLSR